CARGIGWSDRCFDSW
nr:immunoglobulin heavy chain junction region [Macaca mulatta]MOY19335.1 immunoglobulin heavy chain junction region [Macaca mulatta]MOY20637.1 immunoglobulin heavy chain junction region [Macaca mulatta]